MKDGGLDAIFFAVFLSQRGREPADNERAKQRALALFEAVHSSVKANADQAELAFTPGDAVRLEAIGKRAIYLGIENGYAIGRDISLLKTYYDLGARYITLCHSRNNDICDSSTDDDGPEHQGLSRFGEQVVAEMNRLGMMIDVSHASDETFFDVIQLSKAPIMASHSSVRALCNHPRNLDDGMLKALAQNGGVIQLCILGSYIKESQPNPERDRAIEALRTEFGNYEDLSAERQSEMRDKWNAINKKYPRSTANVSDAVDHIDHIVDLIGIDYVGIGTDFDGGGGIRGCNDVSEVGNITLELVRRGYTEEQIRKIWGGNLMRVFRQVEQVAREMKQP
jgi:membrane dipeptidase